MENTVYSIILLRAGREIKCLLANVYLEIQTL